MLYRDISWHDVIINLCWLILMVSIGWFNRLAVLEDLGLGRSRIPQIHVALPLEGQRRHGRRRSPLALLVTHLTIFLFFLVVFLAFCGWFYLQFSSVLSLHSFDSLLYRPVVVCFIIHRRWVDEGRRYAPLTALLYFSIIHYAALDRVECNWFILLQWLMHHRIRLFIKHLTRALRQRWVIVIPSYLFIIINLLFFFVCVFLILLPGDLNPMTWCPSECSLRRTPSGNSLKKTNAITEWIVNGSCRLVDIPSSTCPYVNCTVCISSFVLAFYYYYLFWSRSLCFRSAFDLLSIRFRSDRRGFVSLEASG